MVFECLVNCDLGVLVVKLLCELGKCEFCYYYLFCGEVDMVVFVMSLDNEVNVFF